VLATGGLPYMVVMHGSELIGRLPIGSPLMGRVLRRAEHVVAAGTYPAAETRRATGNGRHTPPITEIPPGVDAQRFRPLASEDDRREARRRLGLPEDGPVVLGLSRLVRRKGFDVLIDAAAQLRRTGVTIAIGGGGRDRERLEKRVRSDNVVFLGRVPDDDLPAAYACADAFAMLCRDQWGGLEQEGFGIVFVEAAACGTPQIAGRSGGSADAVAHGETGVVLDEPTDTAAVVKAIERVLDPATNQRMSKASRERVERDLTYDVLAERLAKVLG
jgi:phosphatidyl-myo-inositol dimannoside synthase